MSKCHAIHREFISSDVKEMPELDEGVYKHLIENYARVDSNAVPFAVIKFAKLDLSRSKLTQVLDLATNLAD